MISIHLRKKSITSKNPVNQSFTIKVIISLSNMRILYFVMKHVYCVMGCLLNLDYAMTFGDKRQKHASYLY